MTRPLDSTSDAPEGDGPSAIGKASSRVGKVTSSIGKVTSSIGKAPSLVGEDLSAFGKSSSSVSEDSSLLGKSSSAVNEDSSLLGAYPTLRFDLIDLEAFLAVVDLGNFTLAAKRLCVSQPSVTGRIQRLEGLLHTKLLSRTTRRVEPTPDGLRLHAAARIALHSLRAVIQEFQVNADVQRSRVVIATTPGIAAVTLPPLIRAYSDLYTDVQMEMQDLQYEEVVANVESGAADMAVIAFDGDSKKFRFQVLAEEEMVLVVPSDHALASKDAATLEEIVAYPLMILGRYTMLRDRITEESGVRGLKLKPMLTASNLATLLGMIDAGNGITFLPKSMAQNNARHTRATIRVADVAFMRTYGILTPARANLNTSVRSFCRYLQTTFSDQIKAVGNAA